MSSLWQVSSDLNTVDLDVAFKLAVSLGSTLNAYTSLGILAILTWPVLFLIIPMVYLCIALQVLLPLSPTLLSALLI